jgi:hypothetical protein
LSVARRNGALIATVGLLVALGGCARSAPSLPPDVGSVTPATALSDSDFSPADLTLACPAIGAEQQAIVDHARTLTGSIEANRTHNQVVGYFGGLFLVPLVAARTNSGEKDQLDAMQARWDTLEMLERHKACPPTPAS